MAFYKKVQQKINGLWYPKSITVNKPINTDQVADRLARISTVSRADTYAVLKELGGVLSDFMSEGRTVKLDGVGTFYYTAIAAGQGVKTKEEATASAITGVRVRFLPETTRTSHGQISTRSLVSNEIAWQEMADLEDGKTGSKPGGDGGDGDLDENPMG
ncbi:MAG: HU family DNA-binding protein [Bacteroides sp.]|nr:HU family DNA-binding protein [Bacteroides sp.]